MNYDIFESIIEDLVIRHTQTHIWFLSHVVNVKFLTEMPLVSLMTASSVMIDVTVLVTSRGHSLETCNSNKRPMGLDALLIRTNSPMGHVLLVPNVAHILSF